MDVAKLPHSFAKITLNKFLLFINVISNNWTKNNSPRSDNGPSTSKDFSHISSKRKFNYSPCRRSRKIQLMFSKFISLILYHCRPPNYIIVAKTVPWHHSLRQKCVRTPDTQSHLDTDSVLLSALCVGTSTVAINRKAL